MFRIYKAKIRFTVRSWDNNRPTRTDFFSIKDQPYFSACNYSFRIIKFEIEHLVEPGPPSLLSGNIAGIECDAQVLQGSLCGFRH